MKRSAVDFRSFDAGAGRPGSADPDLESGDLRLRHLPVIVISGEEDEERGAIVSMLVPMISSPNRPIVPKCRRESKNLELSATRRELDASRASQAQTATTDAVTGAATSHLPTPQLEQALAFAQRHCGEVTLVLIEIDRFQPLAESSGRAWRTSC